MEKLQKTIGYFMASLFVVIGVCSGALITANNNTVGTNTELNADGSVNTCDHVGYHYNAKEPTSTECGWKEFWACCLCHEQFLTQPSGTWSDGGSMIGGVTAGHIAYICPLGSHNFVASTDMIGYYVCSVCGEIGTQLMTSNDVTLTTTNYGINPFRLSSEATDTDITTKKYVPVGSPAYATGEDKAIKLPKVNYALYDEVTFTIVVDHYNSDKLATSLKIGDESLATWDMLNGSKNYLDFIHVYYENASLKVVFEKPGITATTNTITVSDSDVINGTAPLTVTAYPASGRTFYLNSVTLSPKTNSTKLTAEDIEETSLSTPVVFSKYEGTIGGVEDTFVKGALPETTGSYSKFYLGLGDTKYEEGDRLTFNLYIECDSTEETKSTILILENTGGHSWPDNCLLNKNVAHNQWVTLSFPAEKLSEDGETIPYFGLYANGAKAARNYYVQYVSVTNYNTSVDLVAGKSMIDVFGNNCGGAQGNLGNHFKTQEVAFADESKGLGKEVTKLTAGDNPTYDLDRFNLANPIKLPTEATKISFKIYYDVPNVTSGSFNFILCPDGGTAGNKTVAIDATKVNTWTTLTFNNLANIATDGVLDHFNFGTWNGDFVAGASLYIADITIA